MEIQKSGENVNGKKKSSFFLLALLILSALLRLFYYDELTYFSLGYQAEYVKISLNIINKLDFSLDLIRHGPLYFYLLAAVFWSYIQISGMDIVWGPETDIEMENFLFFHIAKDMSIAFSLMSIYLIFVTAKSLFGKKVAVWSSFLYAICPMDIALNQLGHSSSTMTFFVLLTFFYSIKIYRTGLIRYYLAAGIAAGMAMGVRYIFPIVITILTAHMLFYGKGRNWKTLFQYKLIIAALAAVGAFFLSSPFLFLGIEEVIFKIRCLIKAFYHYNSLQPWYYVRFFREVFFLFPLGFGPAAYFGSFWGIARMSKEARWLVFSFPVFFLLFAVLFFPNIVFLHLLPVLPFFAIAGCFLFVSLWDEGNRARKIIGWVFCLLSLFFFAADPFLPVYRSQAEIFQEAGRWIENNIKDPKSALVPMPTYKESYWPTKEVRNRVTYFGGMKGVKEEMLVLLNPEYVIAPNIGSILERNKDNVLPDLRNGKYRYRPVLKFRPESFSVFLRRIALPQEADLEIVVFQSTEKYRWEEKMNLIEEKLDSKNQSKDIHDTLSVIHVLDTKEKNRIYAELGTNDQDMWKWAREGARKGLPRPGRANPD